MKDAHVWPSTAAVDTRGNLSIGGCALPALAREVGTPLYVIDEVTLRASCQAYRRALHQHYPGPSSVHYAGKALLNTAVARLVDEEGLGIDAVSAGEIYVALRAGVPPERIHLHGNAKTRVELEFALDAGVGLIVVDNLDELRVLAELTAGRQGAQGVLLRLTPEVAAKTHAHIQTGHAASKFGIPLDLLDEAAHLIIGSSGLELHGLHFHLGSQILQMGAYEQAIGVLLECAVRLRDLHGLTVRELSPGGGLGVAYLGEDDVPDVDAIVALISCNVIEGCQARRLPTPRLVLEPGRSIVARAGVAVYSVTGAKLLPTSAHTQGVARYVHIDGGMGDNVRPALYGARYLARLANRMHDEDQEVVHVSGRYCESGDVLLHHAPLPLAEVGDVLAVPAAGAYTLSMASNYNLTFRPAVVLVRDGHARLIQRRETYEDLARRDLDLPIPGVAAMLESPWSS